MNLEIKQLEITQSVLGEYLLLKDLKNVVPKHSPEHPGKKPSGYTSDCWGRSVIINLAEAEVLLINLKKY